MSRSAAALVWALTVAGCATPLRLQADAVPRYLCGEASPSVRWTANKPVRVQVTDATQRVLYDSSAAKQVEVAGRLGPVTADMLPLITQASGSGAAPAPLTIEVMSGAAEYGAIQPTQVEYSVYEVKVDEFMETAADLVPYAGRPATDKGASCKQKAANGVCLDLVTKIQVWEVGVVVRDVKWKMHEVFSPLATVEQIENTSPIPIRLGKDTIEPTATLAVQNGAPEDLELRSTIDGAVRIKCGIERRYSDGRCIAAEGLTACRAESGDTRLTACAQPRLALAVRAKCE